MKTNTKKWMKVFIIIFVVIALVVMANNVYAEINVDYQTSPTVDGGQDINKTTEKNPIITPIAQLIYLCRMAYGKNTLNSISNGYGNTGFSLG